MFFTTYHSLTLIIFVVALVVAGTKLSKIRTTSATYSANLFSFACLSLSSWILWSVQYVLLVAAHFFSWSSDFFLMTGLLLGVMQNVLWATALLSLHSRQDSRISLILPLLVLLSVAIGIATYQTPVLSSEAFTMIDAVAGGVIFGIFAYW